MKQVKNILPIDEETFFYPDFFTKEESDQFWRSLSEETRTGYYHGK
ncbi:MAG TPA: hypothetical protein VJ111_02540 [Chitinophagaceae bacterium]|nr:hypothetical protein [Chitinophagaceae bacterium]